MSLKSYFYALRPLFHSFRPSLAWLLGLLDVGLNDSLVDAFVVGA